MTSLWPVLKHCRTWVRLAGATAKQNTRIVSINYRNTLTADKTSSHQFHKCLLERMRCRFLQLGTAIITFFVCRECLQLAVVIFIPESRDISHWYVSVRAIAIWIYVLNKKNQTSDITLWVLMVIISTCKFVFEYLCSSSWKTVVVKPIAKYKIFKWTTIIFFLLTCQV